MTTINLDILNLIDQKSTIERHLSSLPHGTVEIREKNGTRYVYLHTRTNGLARTVYIGEYSDELYERLLKNNLDAKTLKKRLREITKQLKTIDYAPSELSEPVRTNIDYAKRNLVDSIYKQAVLEGVAVTFLDTETIVEGGKINNISADDVQKINNLKHAWQFILDSDVLGTPPNYGLLCTVNKLVEEGFYYNAGRIRSVPVAIGGTHWRPALPIESVVKEELADVLAISDVYERAIAALLYVMKRQIFIDGNKRTAVIFANHILIRDGAGLIVIPDALVREYKRLLIEYYETDNDREIVAFLTDQCLTKL